MNRWPRVVLALSLLVGVVGAAQADRYGHWHENRHWHGDNVGVRTHIILGVDPFWGPLYYPYSYYTPPPTVVVTPPTTYVQPEPKEKAGDYWYYCTSPEGYYPYIKQCPQGWLKVVPQPPPS